MSRPWSVIAAECEAFDRELLGRIEPFKDWEKRWNLHMDFQNYLFLALIFPLGRGAPDIAEGELELVLRVLERAIADKAFQQKTAKTCYPRNEAIGLRCGFHARALLKRDVCETWLQQSIIQFRKAGLKAMPMS